MQYVGLENSFHFAERKSASVQFGIVIGQFQLGAQNTDRFQFPFPTDPSPLPLREPFPCHPSQHI